MAVAVAAVFLKQASVWFPLVNKSAPSTIVNISRNTAQAGLGLSLPSLLTIDWWSWEYVCWPLLAEIEGRTDLPAVYANGIRLAEYLYPLLYSRLAALGKVPAQP